MYPSLPPREILPFMNVNPKVSKVVYELLRKYVMGTEGDARDLLRYYGDRRGRP